MRSLAVFVVLIVFLGCAKPTRADELRPGYLELTQVDGHTWTVLWKAPVLGGLATRTRPALPSFCTLGPAQSRLDGGAVVAAMTATCTRDLAGERVGLAGMDSAYTDALLRIAPLGRPVQAERLTPVRAMVTVATVPDRWQVARTYLALGIDHILAGYDHLLFVIALVLLLRRPWTIAGAATAFTAAHSLTLAGTTLGFIGLAQAPVEALIAVSIVFLAVEIVKQEPDAPRFAERAPWLVAFAFGLIHGFGFAGALREIGLPEGEVPMALVAFNLGVEAGQLVIVAAVLAVLAILRRAAPFATRPAVLAATYVIGTTASFWLIERLL
ncbi:HupE/UreJ protein [Novosphingobium kunmingense]|uniref:HupE/UreJ protein n=1 Tax=Novosphingobium kunmingense TaxID=1211806 RepID=A0A2N0I249_9SPHN|nr:HupE/UreJ family protein [Novosphingobium kunmingense]PKB25264.1 HupE/UreJ protein [Novosphingobium kunmingense]